LDPQPPLADAAIQASSLFSVLRLIPGLDGRQMIARPMNACGLWLMTSCFVCALMGWFALPEQNPSLEQEIARIRAVESENHKALAEYTWQEQETTLIKGKVEHQRLFEVQLGPDGQLRRTPLDLPEENLSRSEKEGGMREWITQKKKHALMTYAQEMKQIAEIYARADPESLRLAYERGDIANEPSPPGNGIKKLSIRNYVKAGDLVTVAVNQQNEIQTLEASSYLTDAKEPVHILVEFVKSRDGLNHVDAITATVPKRNFSLVMHNLTYEHNFQNVRH
jgi:hypothetical protein